MSLDVWNPTTGSREVVRLSPSELGKVKPWEYLLRFFFGGLVTAAVGLVAHRFGPAVAGVFAAFPSILPAALTLVTRHDGRASAAEDSRGACFGAVGLLAFALVVHAAAGRWPAWLTLATSFVAWAVVSVGTWALAVRLRRHHRASGRSGRRPARART